MVGITADLPAGVIDVDACIIEEQPEHLVLAIRVPRASIRQNMPLLAALAERSGAEPATEGRGRVLAAAATQMPERRGKTLRAALPVCAAVFMGSLAATTPTNSLNRPPMTYLSVVNDTPEVAPNGELVMRFTGQRSRICKTDIDRVITKIGPPTEVVWRQRVAGLGRVVSAVPIERTIRVKLPAGLRPGFYFYSSTLFSDCGDGDDHALESPDLYFRVRG
jgi:hypothetical protein